MSRYARKVDDNQGEIVEALRTLGVYVRSLASVGSGCPDLLCGYNGRTVLLEVKDGRRPPSERRLTEAEADFFQDWRGGPIYVVGSVEEAVRAVTGRRVEVQSCSGVKP